MKIHSNKIGLLLTMAKATSVFVLAVLMAACGASTSTPATPTQAAPVQSGTVAPVTGGTAAPALPSGTSAASTTTIDPCQLIDSQEASRLAGTTYGPGQTEPLTGGTICTYGAGTSNVFTVEVAQAPDAQTAQGYMSNFLAALQASAAQFNSQNLNVTQVPDLGDGGVIGTFSVTSPTGRVNGSAVGVLKGATFFGFSDVVNDGSPAPTAATLKTEAQKLLLKIP